MSRINKKSGGDEAGGAPEWMVTFSDCMTLLLTFFVLLLSFSSFDERDFKLLRAVFGKSFSSINYSGVDDEDSFNEAPFILRKINPVKGSEKPTLEEQEEGNLKMVKPSKDFRSLKVFCVFSSDIFWGNGTAVSSDGKNILSDIALYLEEIDGRVVISENSQAVTRDNNQLGLQRSWSVLSYLVDTHTLNKNRFSISTGGTIAGRHSKTTPQNDKSDRILEIALLDRSIYN